MHFLPYSACVSQVTIRRVEDEWIAKAKAEANELGVSMNQVLVEALAKGLGVDKKRVRKNNLDKYACDSDFGPEWDRFLDNDLKRIDDELWS